MKLSQQQILLTLTVIGTCCVSGCVPESAQPPQQQADQADAPAHDHDHPHPHPHPHESGHSHDNAPHDGTLADWGGGEFHVEFTVDHDKQVATVYVLGSDAQTAAPVKSATLLLTIEDPSLQIELLPLPQEGDPPGTSSRFTGSHEGLGTVQEYAGVISGEVDGTPYAGNFNESAHDHDHPHEH